MEPVFEKVKEEGKALRREVRERTLGFITGGLGLVAGLAWNDAIKALIEYIFPLGKDSIPAKFVYAVLISIIVVALSVYLVRLLKTEDDKNIKV
ncbi:MAG: DUF5654 family protein [bacterium]|nr:DUF5654 family protein [bacterium]